MNDNSSNYVNESATLDSSYIYKMNRNGFKKLELRLVMIQDIIFGCSYELKWVEID